MQVAKEYNSPLFIKAKVKRIELYKFIKMIKEISKLILKRPVLIQRNGPAYNEWIEAPYQNINDHRMI